MKTNDDADQTPGRAIEAEGNQPIPNQPGSGNGKTAERTKKPYRRCTPAELIQRVDLFQDAIVRGARLPGLRQMSADLGWNVCLSQVKHYQKLGKPLTCESAERSEESLPGSGAACVWENH